MRLRHKMSRQCIERLAEILGPKQSAGTSRGPAVAGASVLCVFNPEDRKGQKKKGEIKSTTQPDFTCLCSWGSICNIYAYVTYTCTTTYLIHKIVYTRQSRGITGKLWGSYKLPMESRRLTAAHCLFSFSSIQNCQKVFG